MIPGLVAAIDEARADPDQLYLSLSNQERDRKIWPIGGDVVEINGGQIVRPNLRVPFNEVVDINFWEWDGGSDDDFLGRLTVDLTHVGGVRYQVVSNPAEGNVYVVAYSVEGVPSGPPPDTPPPSDAPGVLYAIEQIALDPVTGRRGGGRLLWFRHDGGPGPLGAVAGAPVGKSWEFAHVTAGGDGVIYAVTDDGRLLWYRHDGHRDGQPTWADGGSPRPVGRHWDFTHVSAGRDGAIYAVTAEGRLLWYQHDGRHDGTENWRAGAGQEIAHGWSYAHVFAG